MAYLIVGAVKIKSFYFPTTLVILLYQDGTAYNAVHESSRETAPGFIE